MRKVTLGTTYYNCPDLLREFVDRNIEYVDELIVVDDGSKDPAQTYLNPHPKIRLFIVEKDLGFNSHGCRNLIMSQTFNPWVVLIDIDREFEDPQYTFESIKTRKLKEDVRYRFQAHLGKWGRNVHPSVNDYLINKKLFFQAGGYDEEIVGERWGDRHFFKQLLSSGGKELFLQDLNLRLMREPTIRMKNNKLILGSENKQTHVELIEKRIISPQQNKPILCFDWHEAT